MTHCRSVGESVREREKGHREKRRDEAVGKGGETHGLSSDALREDCTISEDGG